MTLTDEWGPMTRVRLRQVAQRVEETQRGTKWVVKRVTLERDRTAKAGAWRKLDDRYVTVVDLLGHVYADNKAEAEEKAERRYGGANIVVQSAISAQLSLAEQELLERRKAEAEAKREAAAEERERRRLRAG